MGRFSHYHNIQNSQSYGGFIPKIKVPWIIHFNGIFMDFPWNQPSSYWGTPSYGNPSRIEMSYATVIKHPWCTFAIIKPFKTSGSNTPRLVDDSFGDQKQKPRKRGILQSFTIHEGEITFFTSIKGRRGLWTLFIWFLSQNSVIINLFRKQKISEGSM
jgi:hypothetical protein